MSIASRLPLALLPGLLVLALPALGSDLLIVNVEAIKQAAVNAVLDAHPETFEDDLLVDDLLVDDWRHSLILVCMPDRFLEQATNVEPFINRCHVSVRFMLRDSIELQRFVDDNGNCYEARSARGYSVSVYADGTAQLAEMTGKGGSTTWIDCEQVLDSAGARVENGAHRMNQLEIAPAVAALPAGPGLFHIDVEGIREAAAKAADAAYPEYAGGGLVDDDPDRPLIVHCRSMAQPSGEAPATGPHQCAANVVLRITDSIEFKEFLDDDGATCRIASKSLGVEVAVRDDGTIEVGRPRFDCGSSSGDAIGCEGGPDTPLMRDAYDAWCTPGERQGP